MLLPSWLQAMIVVACIGTFGAASYLTVGYFAMHRELDRAGRMASNNRTSESGPQTQPNSETEAVAALNQQLAAISAQYTALKQHYDAVIAGQSANVSATDQAQQDLQQKLAAAQQQLANNSGNVAQLKKSIDELRADLKRSEQARTAEVTHTRQLEDAMQTLTARANLLKAIADSKDEQLARLRAQLAKPGEQVGAVPPANAPASKPDSDSLVTEPGKHSALAPDTVGEGASLTTPEAPVASVAPANRHQPTSKLEQILASTGVDLDKIIGRVSPQPEPAMGGPFVSLDSMRSSALEQQRVAALLKVAKLLPLRSPLDMHYTVGSPFGARHDPFNGREEFHTGIDLDAPYRSTIYSTAPGVVVFTGWKEGYGRTVEIDHGHGIVTLYAHLHRILVAMGERVPTHMKIAQLGSTGRSTGPHLHYEIRLDGRPVNPEKFLEAGKNVVQASAH
ncbi:MAG TPA: peptidoglycan DD-metalloendopeptidase family protein [Stellaceae bacterium]|nr:peptidoglycan DD-metalloendopeptidase family protein [Stellaceae bacterium]